MPEVVIAGVWLEDSHGLMYVVVVVFVGCDFAKGDALCPIYLN